MKTYLVEAWSPEVEFDKDSTIIAQIESSAYWNDIKIEQKKVWWIDTAQDKKLLKYLKQDTNLERSFPDLIKFSKSNGYSLKGVVLELGAGTCWTSAIVSKIFEVEV